MDESIPMKANRKNKGGNITPKNKIAPINNFSHVQRQAQDVFEKTEVDEIIENNQRVLGDFNDEVERQNREMDSLETIVCDQDFQSKDLKNSLGLFQKKINGVNQESDKINSHKNLLNEKIKLYLESVMKDFEPFIKLKSLGDQIDQPKDQGTQTADLDNTNLDSTNENADIMNNTEADIEEQIGYEANLPNKGKITDLFKNLWPMLVKAEEQLEVIEDSLDEENGHLGKFVLNLDMKLHKDYTCKKCFK